MQITAIILAGGKSKRMGTDKALVEVGGMTLIEKAILLCKQVCDTIIISSGHKSHNVFDYPVVADIVPDCGPLGGIFSCLNKSKTQWNFVVSVDAAFVEPEFISFLLTEIDDVDAIVPYTQKGKEPLIALYNKSCLNVMKGNIDSGDFKMHNFLRAVDTKFVNAKSWETKHSNLFHNLNRPDDLNF